MNIQSEEIQISLSNIFTSLIEANDASQELINEYISSAKKSYQYVGYENYCETILIQYLISYFTKEYAEEKRDLNNLKPLFNSVVDKIYIADKNLATSKEFYIKLFDYLVTRMVDIVASFEILQELEVLCDKTDNTILQLEIKKLLLNFYLKSPFRYKDKMKSTSEQITELLKVVMLDSEIKIKNLL